MLVFNVGINVNNFKSNLLSCISTINYVVQVGFVLIVIGKNFSMKNKEYAYHDFAGRFPRTK